MSRNHFLAPLTVLTLTTLVAGIALVHAQGPMPQASAEHQGLEYEVGTWDAESQFWMTPDTEPLVSKAIEINKMLGTMWLISDYQGDMGGISFFGHGQFGYDPNKKKYVGTWIDSMSPYLSVMEGTMDPTTKILTMISKGIDPMTGQESVSKMVSTPIDHDHKKFEIFAPVPGKKGEWWKKMEISYTRR